MHYHADTRGKTHTPSSLYLYRLGLQDSFDDLRPEIITFLRFGWAAPHTHILQTSPKGHLLAVSSFSCDLDSVSFSPLLEQAMYPTTTVLGSRKGQYDSFAFNFISCARVSHHSDPPFCCLSRHRGRILGYEHVLDPFLLQADGLSPSATTGRSGRLET